MASQPREYRPGCRGPTEHRWASRDPPLRPVPAVPKVSSGSELLPATLSCRLGFSQTQTMQLERIRFSSWCRSSTAHGTQAGEPQFPQGGEDLEGWSLLFSAVLGAEHGASCLLGMPSTPELTHSPWPRDGVFMGSCPMGTEVSIGVTGWGPGTSLQLGNFSQRTKAGEVKPPRVEDSP